MRFLAARTVVSALGVLVLVHFLVQVVSATGDAPRTSGRLGSTPAEIVTAPSESPVSSPSADEPPVFDPSSGEWGLWPLNGGKPTIAVGASGGEVRYLQGVLTLKANAALKIDGRFGPLTETAVRNLQSFCGLPVTGVVDEGMWQLIDFLAVS